MEWVDHASTAQCDSVYRIAAVISHLGYTFLWARCQNPNKKRRKKKIGEMGGFLFLALTFCSVLFRFPSSIMSPLFYHPKKRRICIVVFSGVYGEGRGTGNAALFVCLGFAPRCSPIFSIIVLIIIIIIKFNPLGCYYYLSKYRGHNIYIYSILGL